jgi:hypothetical protein
MLDRGVLYRSLSIPVRGGVQVHVYPAASFVLSATNSSSIAAGTPINATFDETPFDLQTRYVTSYFPRDTTMAIYAALNMTTPAATTGTIWLRKSPAAPGVLPAVAGAVLFGLV